MRALVRLTAAAALLAAALIGIAASYWGGWWAASNGASIGSGLALEHAGSRFAVLCAGAAIAVMVTNVWAQSAVLVVTAMTAMYSGELPSARGVATDIEMAAVDVGAGDAIHPSYLTMENSWRTVSLRRAYDQIRDSGDEVMDLTERLTGYDVRAASEKAAQRAREETGFDFIDYSRKRPTARRAHADAWRDLPTEPAGYRTADFLAPLMGWSSLTSHQHGEREITMPGYTPALGTFLVLLVLAVAIHAMGLRPRHLATDLGPSSN